MRSLRERVRALLNKAYLYSLTDEKTVRKIAYAIEVQFNIEILIKQREINLIKEELRKAVESRETLRACILDGMLTLCNEASLRELGAIN